MRTLSVMCGISLHWYSTVIQYATTALLEGQGKWVEKQIVDRLGSKGISCLTNNHGKLRRKRLAPGFQEEGDGVWVRKLSANSAGTMDAHRVNTIVASRVVVLPTKTLNAFQYKNTGNAPFRPAAVRTGRFFLPSTPANRVASANRSSGKERQ